MALQDVHNAEMRLVLSSDAKPRLKWTPELHQCFVDAVNQLGGPEKATPKSLMRVMGIHGLTLYHLKSHLQKYRLGRTQHSQTYQQSKPEDDGEDQQGHFIDKISDSEGEQSNENLKVAHALTLQMEAQRKLHEQIEVLRHLQIRIEAQGKYFESVLKKAQETLSGYSSCTIEVEQAKAQLTQLMSMVITSRRPSPSFSVLTDSEGSALKDAGNKVLGHNGCSMESSLTSSESSGRKEEFEPSHQVHENSKPTTEKPNKGKRKSTTLPLMEMHPSGNRKRSKKINEEANCAEQFTGENSSDKPSAQRFRAIRDIDLNCQYLNEFDSGLKAVDLNFNGVELYNEPFSVKN
ncbi:myb family transcription factor PHL8-like [Andrographis paniculata]|uniref:myb family transcription factor PHL8-like n=1 Tax=Andrographis paniculata TaxID=175694 RepID=UPI0021E74975|nr:myb family transcription factor PHL8-like [Andrographis paniculata]